MSEGGAGGRGAGPTVREAMAIGALAGAALLGGRGGLERQVAWVRLLETPDGARSISPGELLLAGGYPLRDDPGTLAGLVRQVAAARGSGLVLRLGPHLEEVPGTLVADADRLDLPLFSLAPEVAWNEISDPLLERIINAEHWRLKRSLEIHRRFTELVLDGQGVTEIARTLAELLDSAVTVEDAGFHLVAHAGRVSDAHRRETIQRSGTPQRVLFDPQIQAMLRRLEANRHPMKVPAFPHLGMARERIIAPITAAGQTLGYISVLDQPPESEDLALTAVEQAAIVIALALSKEREVSEVEERVRGELLDDLVQGTFGDESAAQRRARHVGYPLAGRHVLMVVDIDDFRGFVRARALAEDSIQALKREYLRRVAAVARATYPRALLHARSDSVLALLPVGEGPEAGGHLVELGEQARAAVSDWDPGFTVSVGLSAPVRAPDGVATAHREVRAVLDTLARFRRRGRVVAVPELGLTGLLAGVNHERLMEFEQRHLGALGQHDASRHGSLLETLRAYLESGEQQAAARRLKIHPNTLRYRLDRIREVTGSDLDDPETRLNLAVALRVHSLLGL